MCFLIILFVLDLLLYSKNVNDWIGFGINIDYNNLGRNMKKVFVDKYLIRFRIEYFNLFVIIMGYMILLFKVILV